jgi:4-diphosphocytidyl-2-C-methyl-D-erythritol kinase
MLKILAPAKINLSLEVLAKRSDGFHEIRSVTQTIKLYDSFYLRLAEKIVIKCDDRSWLAEKSLIPRAAELIKENSAHNKGAIIELSKKIPLLSGLGGDSSDAAAILLGLNKLWGLTLAPGELARLASQLGSDVPLFLFDGTVLLQGRGELVSPLPPLQHMWVILLIPPVPRSGGKTGRLYARLNRSHYTNGQITEKLVSLLAKGSDVAQDNLFNVFEDVAFDVFKGLDEYRQMFFKAGAANVHLAGSGPALFTIVKEKTQADKIYTCLKKQGIKVYLTETMDNPKSVM